MKTMSLALLASVAAAPLLAQETREIGAHVHGVSNQLWDAVWVTGTLSARMQSTNLGDIGYELSANAIEVYSW